MEGLHHSCDMARKSACLLQYRSLISAKSNELQRNWKPPFQRKLCAKQGFNGIVEIDAAWARPLLVLKARSLSIKEMDQVSTNLSKQDPGHAAVTNELNRRSHSCHLRIQVLGHLRGNAGTAEHFQPVESRVRKHGSAAVHPRNLHIRFLSGRQISTTDGTGCDIFSRP